MFDEPLFPLTARLVQAMPACVLWVDPQGRIRMVNARAARLFGYPPEALQGQLIECLVPERFRSGHAGMRKGFMEAPDTREMGSGRELFGLRADGSEFPVEVGLNLLPGSGRGVLAVISDITERLEARHDAAAAHALAQSIIEAAPFPLLAIDLKGLVLEASPSAAALLNRPRDALLGQPLPVHALNPENGGERQLMVASGGGIPGILEGPLGKRLQAGQMLEGEWLLHRPGEPPATILLAVNPLRQTDGRIEGFLFIAHDISDRKRQEQRIRHLAEHDALTGLPNRVQLRERFAAALGSARRAAGRCAVLLIDLDHFKRVNDSLGHAVGDRLLITLAERLRRSLRHGDTVARMGGDEFVVVLPDIQDEHVPAAVANKLLQAARGPVNIDQHVVQVSLSIGVALFPEDGDDSETLLRHADTAMYAAKEAGRDRCVVFRKELGESAAQRWRMEAAMREALARGGFQIHYQPQINLRERRVTGVEALLRWPEASADLREPDAFIPVAEQIGLIAAIGEHVLRTACTQIGALSQRLDRPLRLAVNVSAHQIAAPDYAEQIAQSLAMTGFPAHSLEVEITESALLCPHADEVLGRLHALGVGIAMDDFGTGFSSLSRITHLPVDRLKIDRSFVRDLGRDAQTEAVTAGIMTIAKRLGITVVAEGVETTDQVRALIGLHCLDLQGYRYSPAVSLEALPATIERIERALATEAASQELLVQD
jgi:diguanylate cyclase (GGDEF)-like protein/PAS domain S-box-containing protein